MTSGYKLRHDSDSPHTYHESDTIGQLALVKHRWFDTSLKTVTFPIKISDDYSRDVNYFWSNVIIFRTLRVAYIGLQKRGHEHIVLFSVFSYGDDIKFMSGSGVCVNKTEHTDCELDYNWQLGSKYELKIHYEGRTLIADILSVNERLNMRIAVFETLHPWADIYETRSYLEEFTPGATCADLSNSLALFYRPINQNYQVATCEVSVSACKSSVRVGHDLLSCYVETSST